MKVQADAAKNQAENERKIAELQAKGMKDGADYQAQIEKLRQSGRDMEMKAGKMQAEIDNLTANTAKTLASIGLDERKQQLSEYTAASAAQSKQVDQAMQAQGMRQEAAQGDRKAALSERQQSHAETMGERSEARADRQQDYSERSGDRQQAFAEQQAAKEPAE
jgi:hypothetical protein